MTPGRRIAGSALIAGVMFAAAAPAAVVAADNPEAVDGPAAVATLHTVTPTAVGPDDTLTLAGTVTNNGDEVLSDVQALPRYSLVPLEDSDAVDDWYESDDSIRSDLRYRDPYDLVAEELGPGESAEFSLVLPVDQVGFRDAGVYAVGVDLRGDPEGGNRLDLARARTVVTWLPDDEPLPSVPVALIWPIAAQPALLPSGALRDDSLAAHVGPDGYLRAAVDAVGVAAEAPVTWAVDPDLVTTATVMADGYDIVSGDTTVPGATVAADDAATWRESFITATANGEVMLLPYARPDVEALAEADPDLAGSIAADARTATTRAMPDVSPGAITDHAWVDGRGIDHGSLDALARAGVTTVIASADAVEPSTSGFAKISTSGKDVDAVLTDPGLDAAISAAAEAADPEAGAAELRQRWTAETALAALDAAADHRDPAPMIAAPPLRWQPESATAAAVIETWTGTPWVEPTVLSGLDVPDEPVIVDPAPDDGSDALPPAAVAATAALRTEAERYESVLAEPGGVGDVFDLASLRAASTGWRDDPAAGEAYTTGLTTLLTAELGKVAVTVPESVTLSSHSGVFPLTLTNDLDEPVLLRLDIQSTNVDRLRVGEVQPQRVEAGERATVTVSAEAASNGKVPIEVRLVAGDGSPLGPSERTVVNATDYGTIGWVIMAAAGLVFGWTLVRRAINSRRAGAGTDESPTRAAAEAEQPAGSVASDPAPPPTSDQGPAPGTAATTRSPEIMGRSRRRPSEPEQVTR